MTDPGQSEKSKKPAPSRSEILQESLRNLHQKYHDCEEGEVATYIPDLAKADPRLFGVAVADVNGQVHEYGDSQTEFTIQSISKPFVYGIALEACGRPEVLRRIGVEPSGDAFNGIEFQKNERPHNAMINAGAITATSMVPGKTAQQKIAYILEIFSNAAGRELTVDQATYRSESDTGHRNRAIAYLLRNLNLLGQDLDEVLEAYFMQCSVLVTARDLAMMGASLGNIGMNPVSGQPVLGHDAVRDVLSVMFTCGMYDFAGEWAFRVGLPAKSGVSGGIMSVVNRQFGIGAYSPRLDPMGNSVRAVRLCADFAEENGLHVFHFTNIGSTYVDATWGLN